LRKPPRRGEVWLVNLAPIVGHEQAGRRPAVVISEDEFNSGPADLVILLPITSTLRPIPSQVSLSPPDGGLDRESAVLCEAIRSVSRRRLVRRLRPVSAARLGLVEDALRILLGL
jgi:mRNA interferase MazF